MRVPAEVYQPSARTYTGTPEDLDYGGMETRRVKRQTGTIGYGKESIMISTAVGGWSVGLSARAGGLEAGQPEPE